jgi:hypothetical protein
MDHGARNLVEDRDPTTGSSDGTNLSGSLGNLNVVDKCIGGATSVTRFNGSSACNARVAEWTWSDPGILCERS